ncbi:uncharacterized protein PG998_006600 [Apiospora kogelbergensis]|uniref:uncharacterized protein n=1 Tax=Apiospora kogelbergensis TaxID=1337665 RepID=UPI00312D61BC
MAFNTVRNLVETSCAQRTTETIGIVLSQVVMKTPMSILTPVANTSKTLGKGLKMVPVLGRVDLTQAPVVGERALQPNLSWNPSLTVDIGPLLVSLQLALAARGLVEKAEHAIDPSALTEGLLEETNASSKVALEVAEGLMAETNAMSKAALEALGGRPEILGITAGERMLAEQLAASSHLLVGQPAAAGASLPVAGVSLPVAQGELLGHQMKIPVDILSGQVAAKRRLTPLGGLF